MERIGRRRLYALSRNRANPFGGPRPIMKFNFFNNCFYIVLEILYLLFIDLLFNSIAIRSTKLCDFFDQIVQQL